MKFLIAQPNNSYFLWQMLVQINNFRRYGLEEDLIYVIGNTNKDGERILQKIINSGLCDCQFYIYNDTRKNSRYPSSLRPHLLSKFFNEHPYMSDEVFFYTDPDVLFTKEIDFTKYEHDDVWYLSDTISYIGANYIKSKGEKLLDEMCDIVNISREIVENNQQNSGGAQYILKNINSEYWDKVYKDCEALYIHMDKTSNIYTPNHPIQKWTADMWAVLWNAWYFGNETKIVNEFDFAWATDHVSKWEKCSIFHNAGVVRANDEKHFSKIAHQTSPFNKELTADENNCSYNYIKEIKDTEKNFKEILF